MKTAPLIVGLALAFLFTATCSTLRAETDPLTEFTHTWRDDPIWYDGLAECATYEATRTIYGTPRPYTARIFTNKEHVSPETFTKSADGTGRATFKLHVRDDVPTENYTYHFSTMTYVGIDDLKSLKLDMGSSEDCGATFKQYINHAGTLRWRQNSYFPDEGEQSGKMKPGKHFAFQDALPLILRGYPFDTPPKTLELQLLRDQTDTHLTPPNELSTGVAIVKYRGLETLELPYGEMQAHHLTLWLAPDWQEQYWFAADPALRHIMVRHEGGHGIDYQLKTLERAAYWRH